MDLMELLPGFYDANETMIRLQAILSAETESLDTGLSQTISECFVSTASAMLSRYEKLYGLEVDVSKTNTFRRERIKAKIAGSGTTTKQMIIDTAKSFSNGDVEVIEDNSNSRFTIKFVGTLGIPGNLADLKLTIEEIKPAHLAVTYEYVYTTYGALGHLTYGEAAAYTYEQLRTVNV